MRNAAAAQQATRPIIGNPSTSESVTHLVRYQSRNEAGGPPTAAGAPGQSESMCFSLKEAHETAVRLVENGEARPCTISFFEKMDLAVAVAVASEAKKI